MNATKTIPPGLVTRTISASIVRQSPTCSSTLEEKQMSTAPEASGRRSAVPTALSASGRPRAASSPRLVSTHTARAPAPCSSRMKKPGPPPTSATTRPGRRVYWLSWLMVSRARAV